MDYHWAKRKFLFYFYLYPFSFNLYSMNFDFHIVFIWLRLLGYIKECLKSKLLKIIRPRGSRQVNDRIPSRWGGTHLLLQLLYLKSMILTKNHNFWFISYWLKYRIDMITPVIFLNRNECHRSRGKGKSGKILHRNRNCFIQPWQKTRVIGISIVRGLRRKHQPSRLYYFFG